MLKRFASIITSRLDATACSYWIFMATMIENEVPQGLNADPMIPQLYRVDRVRDETDDTFTFSLVPENGEAKISFLPASSTCFMFLEPARCPFPSAAIPR